MKSNIISVLLVALLAVTVADRAAADGQLTNYAGYVRSQVSPEQTTLEIADYLSVYRFELPMFGTFDVALFDNRTPLTAANFRGYADRGDYDTTFMHRSVATANAGIGIVQGGGFTMVDQFGDFVPSGDPVPNEPGMSNTVGTLALAKTGAGLHTGTNQWYFNTTDNPNLDNYNYNPSSGVTTGAYTVFGEVLYDGMDVVGLDGGVGGIANLPTSDLSFWHSAFTDLPLADSYDGNQQPLDEEMVLFSSISQVTGQTYAVVGNTNTALVTEVLLGTSLTLDVTADMVGRADVTIRVTDPTGQWFDASLRIEVAPALSTLGENWGYSSVTWADGDLNGDGEVNLTDLTIWGTYHATPPASPQVPEPATCMLLGIGGLVSLARRRR